MDYMDNNLPKEDQIHIEQIRKYLWSGREYGRAAVMVGGGFSRNAERFSVNTRAFPLWSDLGEIIYKILNPRWNEQSLKSSPPVSGIDTVQYASQYETIFGRLALHNLLLENIPDNEYTPGNLHELLLSLPWSDVFTTNYDTLLERTLPKIFDKKYDIIQNISQIPTKMKPRIIKLHGSFPSSFPLIITQNDYNHYTEKFAPFTNIVQQSVMENIFCLIGFSGDDPNFTRWVKWVRDYLKESAPLIYLCGILDADPDERYKFEEMGVKLIDLAPLFPHAEWLNQDERHRCALEWFLWTLKLGEPQNTLIWPKPTKLPLPKMSSIYIPKISTYEPPLPDLGPSSPKTNTATFEELLELSTRWRKQRLNYPGWVITPEENRQRIWIYTHDWINPIVNSIELLNFPNNLYLLFELIWRFERSLIPPFVTIADIIMKLLLSINPYPHIIHLDNAEYRSDIDELRTHNWKEIGEIWVHLAFAMARQTREFFNESEHQKWMGYLEKICELKKEWKIRYFYEDSLYNLFLFNHEQVYKILHEWPEEPDTPHFSVKRAAILAELGELTEARRLLATTLDRIRSHLPSNLEDYTLLSQEGWTMFLLNLVDYGSSFPSEDVPREEYNNRWDRLGHYRCNPLPEIERLRMAISHPPKRPKPRIERNKDFDPGRVIDKLQFTSDQYVEGFLPAFSFLRVYEEAGIPMNCGLVSVYTDEIANASDYIETFVPFWSFNAIIRSRKTERVKNRFSRSYIAALSQEQMNTFCSLLVGSLNKSVQYLIENPSINNKMVPSFQYKQVIILSEVLSRLCIRFSPSEITQMLELTIKMYKNPVFYRDISLYDGIEKLFKRIFHSMENNQVLSLLPQLLSLPVANENDYHPAFVEYWVEPFNYINFDKDVCTPKEFDWSLTKREIERLLRIAKFGDNVSRSRSLLRLYILISLGVLDLAEKHEFAEVLWDKTDPKTGLPDNTLFLKSAFLRLPEIENSGAKEKFINYLSSLSIPRQVVREIAPDGKQISIKVNGSNALINYLMEWESASPPIICPDHFEDNKYIDWTPNERSDLLFKIAEVWDDLKGLLSKSDKKIATYTQNSLNEQFSVLIRLLNVVILPYIRQLNDCKEKKLIFRLLSEMEELGINVLSAYPFILQIETSYYEQLTSKLRESIISQNPSRVHDALTGMYHWVWCSRPEHKLAPPQDLLNEMIRIISTRRQAGLEIGLNVISTIVECWPEVFSQDQMQEIYIGLEYLSVETDLAHLQERKAIQSELIAPDDKPDIRRHSAVLAYNLYKHCTAKGDDIPKVLNKWRQICENDPLPEVRKAWGK